MIGDAVAVISRFVIVAIILTAVGLGVIHIGLVLSRVLLGLFV